MSEPKKLTPEELDKIRKHPRGSWGPLLLDHIAALEAEHYRATEESAKWALSRLGKTESDYFGLPTYAQIVEELVKLKLENARLRDALERIRDGHHPGADDGYYWNATECRAIAKQALFAASAKP